MNSTGLAAIGNLSTPTFIPEDDKGKYECAKKLIEGAVENLKKAYAENDAEKRKTIFKSTDKKNLCEASEILAKLEWPSLIKPPEKTEGDSSIPEEINQLCSHLETLERKSRFAYNELEALSKNFSSEEMKEYFVSYKKECESETVDFEKLDVEASNLLQKATARIKVLAEAIQSRQTITNTKVAELERCEKQKAKCSLEDYAVLVGTLPETVNQLNGKLTQDKKEKGILEGRVDVLKSVYSETATKINRLCNSEYWGKAGTLEILLRSFTPRTLSLTIGSNKPKVEEASSSTG